MVQQGNVLLHVIAYHSLFVTRFLAAENRLFLKENLCTNFYKLGY